MIDGTHALSVAQQCKILPLSHSTADYWPHETEKGDLALMRIIDGCACPLIES
ncbi:MAG: hypothetical protein NVSMB6_05790 [Burkholderiaceae bacterium]